MENCPGQDLVTPEERWSSFFFVGFSLSQTPDPPSEVLQVQGVDQKTWIQNLVQSWVRCVLNLVQNLVQLAAVGGASGGAAAFRGNK